MTDVTENKKRPTLKIIAIAAFIGLITLVAWLSIQLVNSAPGAFNSLASIAESVNQQTSVSESIDENPVKLVVASDKTLINTQEAINISWNTTQTPGSYTFSYICAEGVAIDIVDDVQSFQNISCDTNYNIGNVDSLTLSVESEKARFENISYTISFLTTSGTTPSASGIASFMVVNSSIQNDTIATENEETDVTEPEVVIEPTENSVVATPSVPVFEQQFTFTIPVSDPNGRTDLSTQFIATGVIIGNTFFPQAVTRNSDGAIQFEVKNFGTKTSKDWTFSVVMPNGNIYKSTTEEPLKPNERAVLTIGFPAAETAQHIFAVTLNAPTDKNARNDQFVQVVNFAR